MLNFHSWKMRGGGVCNKFTRHYLISEKMDNSGWPLTASEAIDLVNYHAIVITQGMTSDLTTQTAGPSMKHFIPVQPPRTLSVWMAEIYSDPSDLFWIILDFAPRMYASLANIYFSFWYSWCTQETADSDSCRAGKCTNCWEWMGI